MALQHIRRTGTAMAAVAGLGALLVACGSNELSDRQAQVLGAAGAPMSIACEPNQRAIVRQAIVNGVVQAQAECQSVGVAGTARTFAAAASAAPAPIAYGYSEAPLADTQLVRTAYPQPAVARAAAPERVVYQPAPERRVVEQPKRSVKKSAVIIGSSAGVGAGIGAIAGGKKGAGIGALIGGGAAALWDQITRRK